MWSGEAPRKAEKKGGKAKCAPDMDRDGRASGGRTKRTKGKTNINIVISAGAPREEPAAAPPPPMMPPRMPPPPVPGMTAPGPMGAPPMGAPPPGLMGRKSGGKVYRSYKDMDAGALGGKGRLEKTEIQKHKG